MGVQFEVKKLDPEHWFVYKHLRLESLKNDPQAFIGIHEEKLKVPDDIWREQFSREHTRILFLFEGVQAIGIAGYDINHISKNAHVASIFGVYIMPDYRGKDLGKMLVSAVIDDIVKHHPQIIKIKLAVSSSQTAAFHIYESLGFKNTGTLKMEIKHGEEFFDEILLEKFIATRNPPAVRP
jgi:ribosomal protein S18 acetylase RimI-like enzyme